MIIRYVSDLHIDFSTKEVVKNILPKLEDDKDSVLIIAGDTSNGLRGSGFIKDMSKRFKYVITIMGNHEYYGKDFQTATAKYKKSLENYSNVYLLDDEAITIHIDKVLVNFFGCTLWTDFGHDHTAMVQAGLYMNDFAQIRNSTNGSYSRKLLPIDTVQKHTNSINEILNYIEFIKEAECPQGFVMKNFVISHHLPHYASVNNRFKNSISNPAFVTNLDGLIEDSNIDYWIHGHTHSSVSAVVHKTLILCNPRGYESYPLDFNNDFNSEAYIEIS